MPATSRDVAVISDKILQQIRKGVNVQFPTADSVVLHKKDLQSIRSNAKYISPAEFERTKQLKLQQKQERNKKAQLRKQKMLELERKAKSAKPRLSALEQQKLRERQAVLDEADAKILKNHDKVKKMDSLVLYAKCAAIRDRQLVEKEALKAAAIAANQEMDELMEIDRLNAIEKMAARDKARVQSTRASAEIIVKQLHQNEKMRLIQKEQKILEGVEMVAKIQRQQKEEERKQAKRAQEGAQLLEEIKRSNQQISAMRAQEKERQRLEDEKIAKYLRDKDQREAAYEQELADIEAQKERKKEQISAKQGQAMEQAVALENIRIRRSQEKAEREWRAKQQVKALKKEETKRVLFEARERQRLEKELRLAQQATIERMEFEKNVNAFHAQQHEIERQQQEQHTKKQQYRDMLQHQMCETEKLRGAERMQTQDKKLEMQREAAQLAQIKKQKLAEMAKYGVPAKYMADLVRFKLDQN